MKFNVRHLLWLTFFVALLLGCLRQCPWDAIDPQAGQGTVPLEIEASAAAQIDAISEELITSVAE